MQQLNILKIIDKKSAGKELTREEIDFFVLGYLNGKIPDYQMSSLLMAITINGMTKQETIKYTEALINTGEIIDSKNEIWVDKHSTGGIGDKVSLVLGPLLAACGCKIAKLSGRALGFTGGTLDKLESIQGFSVDLSKEEFVEQVNKIGVAIVSPLKNLVPADKKIYALRDVTGTVSSLPLIASSVMSKKIASGAKYIVIDLKVGEGAFIKTIGEGKKLGNLMKDIGKAFDREVFILFSTMAQPLGWSIGNGIEVKEAVETLKGKGPEDFKELVIKIAYELISRSKNISKTESLKLIKEAIESGSAYKKFVEWMISQGANKKSLEEESYFKPFYKTLFKASKNGFVNIMNVEQFGWLAIELGAGRKTMKDTLDYNVGFKLKVKAGQKVNKYDTLIEIYSERELTEDFLNSINKLFEINAIKPKVEKLIIGEIKW